jgi:hypothetical protein
MTEQTIYDFLRKSLDNLEMLKEDIYQFEVRVNIREEIQLRVSSRYYTELTIHTEWNRNWEIDEPHDFQDCTWGSQIFNCNLSDLNDITLRSMLEEAENKLSISLSN